MEGLSESVELSPVLQNQKLCCDFELNENKSIESAGILINPVTSSISSSDDETNVIRIKRRVKKFCESDSGTENENAEQKNTISGNNTENVTDDSDNPRKSIVKQSLKKIDSATDSNELKPVKNEGQLSRMANKRTKIREKFKSLLTSRSKNDSESEDDSDRKSEDSDHDVSSVDKIKQVYANKIKLKMSFDSSICDPDTSDEDDKVSAQKRKKNQKKQHKAIMISPKPMRISAKQAMENMQKIKSESNRLLREKEVSLPYHRPKALSLKDIMNRRKPALAADGKILPIKMNEQQLKEYVLLLEQRQKEMMELCKSDTDEEIEKVPDNKNTILEDSKLQVNQFLEHNNIVKMDIEEIAANTDNGKTTAQNIKSLELDANKNESKDNKREHENNNCPIDMNISEEKMDIEIKLSNKDTDTITSNVVDLNTFKQNDMFTEDTTVKQTPNIDTNTCKENDIAIDDSRVEQFSNIDINIWQKNNLATEDTTANIRNIDSEKDSQLISLYYDESENVDMYNQIGENTEKHQEHKTVGCDKYDFSDDDIDFGDIDKIIEKSEIIKDKLPNSRVLLKENIPLKLEPKITGAPGMVIDLDNSDTQKKPTGLELLKERFTYFAKLKTPEELERERETKFKPGMQHQKLKQELEEKIAEQRSIEWAKRYQEEKQQEMELKALRGEISDNEDDIEKIEAKLAEDTVEPEESSEEEEEEEEVNVVKEVVRKKNSMIDDEAEVSDCDDYDDGENNEMPDGDDNEDISSDYSSDDELSHNEQPTQKKGRILKGFEDSDDESTNVNDKITINSDSTKNKVTYVAEFTNISKEELDAVNESHKSQDIVAVSQEGSEVLKESQDDPIQLAQRMNSLSDDLFSQESDLTMSKDESFSGTQSFSILDSTLNNESMTKLNKEKIGDVDKTQCYDFDLNNAALNSGSYTEIFIPSQITKSVSTSSQSQPLGEDILALCTGQFYGNEFITQTNGNLSQTNVLDNNDLAEESISNKVNLAKESTNSECVENEKDFIIQTNRHIKDKNICYTSANVFDKCDLAEEVANSECIEKAYEKTKESATTNIEKDISDGNVLLSILEELHDPEFDSQKPNKYFINNPNSSVNKSVLKKKFVIDSDEEGDQEISKEQKKKKNYKKRKLESRALHISDDEDSAQSDEDVAGEHDISDIENEAGERIIEYDSEENEIEVQPQITKKKRKATDFFEQEAELTSEDEWVGSGDEDEAGLDRMEKEEGDDDVFHQSKLQKELGQIHMREVLDQDKREVRLIQELLFEDGDLGDGHRQRKFRWKNADGKEETDMQVEGFTDTQEEEFESEELWRKQRHEREVFLRQLENKDQSAQNVNVSLNRTTIIKANLSSKTMSSLLMEVNSSTSEKNDRTDDSVVKEKKIAEPQNPTKMFTIFKQNYHNSLLTRGRGALARLAALATPLAVDDDATKVGTMAPTNRRNFVFTSVTPNGKETTVSKRKADGKADTPRLVKKLKTDEKKIFNKNSLLNHLKV